MRVVLLRKNHTLLLMSFLSLIITVSGSGAVLPIVFKTFSEDYVYGMSVDGLRNWL